MTYHHDGAWVFGLLMFVCLLNVGRAFYQQRHPVLSEKANRVFIAVAVTLAVLVFYVGIYPT